MHGTATATVPAAEAPRTRVVQPFRLLALLVALLVLVQAALAGRWMFAGAVEEIRVHGWLGNASFLGAVLLVVLAFVGWRAGAWGAARLVLGVVLVGLMVAQLGLGYVGREQAVAAALHVPNGVLIAMVLAALLSLAWLGSSARPAREV